MGNFNLLNHILKGCIILIFIYLYYTGSITINRIIIFLIVFGFIIWYSWVTGLIVDIFNNKTIKKYVKDNCSFFFKLIVLLLNIYKWINPFIPLLTYTDKCLFKINRYITGTKLLHYNFIIYVIVKYLLMFGLVKLILYKYYKFWYHIDKLTIIDILFKRMYGLILSVLIFTDIFNKLILYVSNYGYGIWSFIIIYYIISMLCIIIELLFYYNYLEKWIINLLYYKIVDNLVILKYIMVGILYIIRICDIYLKNYTKMNIIIFLRSNYTWLGQIISSILEIISPRLSKETNYKEFFIHRAKFNETQGLMSGGIAYYIPQTKRIPFKYFNYIGSLMNIGYFDATYQLYWESFKNDWSYKSFFRSIRELKGKPSIFLYKQIKNLLILDYTQNQPINRLMDWIYFYSKSIKYSYLLGDNEKIIVNNNLQYLKKVDNLRAKLMFNIIWDIEYFYNENNKNYNWDYWIMQYNSILEVLIFQMDYKFQLKLCPNITKLEFYDPEYNMEYLNRLFNVLGIINNVYIVDNEEELERAQKGFKGIIEEDNYYVSSKFNNYNAKYEALLTILYSYEFKFNRWAEPQCDCKYLSLYEVEISYKIEDYLQSLRKEWEDGLKKEKLEGRNWKLLKELEELMVND